MDDYHPILIIITSILALAGLSAFFELTSVAITKSRSKRLRELLKDRNSGNPKLGRYIISQANSYLLSGQAGMLICAVSSGFLLLFLSDSICENFCGSLMVFLGSYEYLVWLLLATTLDLILVLSLVQAGKAFAFNHPEIVLSKSSVALVFFNKLFRPLTFLIEFGFSKILKLIGSTPPVEREVAVSAEELSEIVEMSSEAGEIEEEEKDMIQGVFHFSDTVVREVMTPRQDIIFVEENASLEIIVKTFTTERLSRIVVTGADLDDVRGILLAKDFIGLIGHDTCKFDLSKLLRPAYFVANTKKVDALLQEFKRDALHFAVVLDEHGGVDGVVTVEDLIEEIVGEILDEHDCPTEEPFVQLTAGGDLLVDGSILVDDLNANHALHIPKGQYDTVAGFIIDKLGHIPTVGEKVEFEAVAFKVEAKHRNRITRVLISKIKKNNKLGRLAVDLAETPSNNNESNHRGTRGRQSVVGVDS